MSTKQRYRVEHSVTLGFYIVDTQTSMIVLRNLATSELAINRRNELEAANDRAKGRT